MTSWLEQRSSSHAVVLALGAVLGTTAGCADPSTSKSEIGKPAAAAGGSSGTAGGTGVEVGPDGRPIVADPTNPEEVAKAVDPKRESGLQRLTKSQYVNTVSDVFAAAAAGGLDLEVDYRSAGFASIGGREVAISRSGVRKYEAAARLVAERVTTDTTLRSKLVGCNPQGAQDAACLTAFVNATGKRLFRRPLSNEEAQRFAAVGTSAAQAFSEFWQGARFALTGLLLSPNFLHQVELGTDRGGQRVLTDLELATRLSYFLWDTTPDEALLSAAERGELAQDASVQRSRLLADSARLAQGVRAFSEDLFALHELDSAPQSAAFPVATPSLYASMREAVQRLTVEVAVQQRGDFRNILTPGFAFVDGPLSSWYGMSAPASGFTKVPLAASSPRVGLLTEPAILALTSRATRSSITLRGIFVSHLVCFDTPPPPPNVNATLPDRMAGMTRRQQLELHMNQPTCAACHKTIDPIGFGLDRFDAIGREVSQDAGGPVDTAGTYFDKPFNGAAELSNLVKADPRVATCTARKAYMHGLARLPETAEDVLIEPLAQAFAAGGHNLTALLGKVAESGLFQLAPKPSQ